ncbi:vignain-like [Prunus yedoensis var. nudiflora]|uniref:Vignain-like n=1 Tax=Prunus yedoensis var. nudiflora TaxID=2094558 RepID=A0A314YWH5_PRUYE|nr:vignain-like [Prunus yedoensis var. nudiflora]
MALLLSANQGQSLCLASSLVLILAFFSSQAFSSRQLHGPAIISKSVKFNGSCDSCQVPRAMR